MPVEPQILGRLMCTKTTKEMKQCIMEFCAEIGQLNCLLTDYGTEFMGSFRDCWFEKGIKMKKSCLYVAWMNGLVESKNCCLKECSRQLLIHAGLGPKMHVVPCDYDSDIPAQLQGQQAL